MCRTLLFDANRDIAACTHEPKKHCWRAHHWHGDCRDSERPLQTRAVNFISLDQYVRFPIERPSQTNPSDGGILSGFIATFVANFRLRDLRRCSHPLALMTDLYHRRARRKTPRRNSRMARWRGLSFESLPVPASSAHFAPRVFVRRPMSATALCVANVFVDRYQPAYAHCCTRVCPAADASQFAHIARVIFDGLEPGLAGMKQGISSMASFAWPSSFWHDTRAVVTQLTSSRLHARQPDRSCCKTHWNPSLLGRLTPPTTLSTFRRGWHHRNHVGSRAGLSDTELSGLNNLSLVLEVRPRESDLLGGENPEIPHADLLHCIFTWMQSSPAQVTTSFASALMIRCRNSAFFAPRTTTLAQPQAHLSWLWWSVPWPTVRTPTDVASTPHDRLNGWCWDCPSKTTFSQIPRRMRTSFEQHHSGTHILHGDGSWRQHQYLISHPRQSHDDHMVSSIQQQPNFDGTAIEFTNMRPKSIEVDLRRLLCAKMETATILDSWSTQPTIETLAVVTFTPLVALFYVRKQFLFWSEWLLVHFPPLVDVGADLQPFSDGVVALISKKKSVPVHFMGRRSNVHSLLCQHHRRIHIDMFPLTCIHQHLILHASRCRPVLVTALSDFHLRFKYHVQCVVLDHVSNADTLQLWILRTHSCSLRRFLPHLPELWMWPETEFAQLLSQTMMKVFLLFLGVCSCPPQNRRLPRQVPCYRSCYDACPQIFKNPQPFAASAPSLSTVPFEGTLGKSKILLFFPVCKISEAMNGLLWASVRSRPATAPFWKAVLQRLSAPLFWQPHSVSVRLPRLHHRPGQIRHIHRRGCPWRARLRSDAFACPTRSILFIWGNGSDAIFDWLDTTDQGPEKAFQTLHTMMETTPDGKLDSRGRNKHKCGPRDPWNLWNTSYSQAKNNLIVRTGTITSATSSHPCSCTRRSCRSCCVGSLRRCGAWHTLARHQEGGFHVRGGQMAWRFFFF